ncbi:MAG TPA: hypothetical protein VHH36_08790, partial [Candidatus Thermoplasmatota archaeon]|nr:hypothetical protein [Candidatus Thermoplasmatota archaeon]
MSEPSAKPRVEVVEETAEALDVIDLDRTPRPEKWARESRHLASGHEAAFAERAFRPRRPETLDEIRAAVDA